MFSSANDVYQSSSFGNNMNLMRSSWEMNQSQDKKIKSQSIGKHIEKGLPYMLNLHQNYVTVKEGIMQFDDKFEMLIEVNEEMLELQGGSNEAA